MTTEQVAKKDLVPDWQVTATTIICDRVAHEATIMIYKDWSAACAYHKSWGPIRRETKKGIGMAMAKIGFGSEEQHLPADCPGPEKCPNIDEYREKLYQEEITAQSQQ